MSNKAVRVGRRDLLREAIRAEKRRMLARVLAESGPERERLLREIVAANELITWYDACRTLQSFLQNALSRWIFPGPGGANPAASGQAGAVL